MKKILLLKLLVILFLVITDINAQYNVDLFNRPDLLETNIHSFLVNNNFDRVEVTQNNPGEIKLKGAVSSYYDKQWLYENVSRIYGVREVSNLVVVDDIPVSDEIMESNIHKGILYVSFGKQQNINVEVNNGVVFLNGVVDNIDDKKSAHKIASLYDGVRGIVNKIKVQPVTEALFKNGLKNFLTGIISERFPDEKEIEVNVSTDGVVTLEGKVSSEDIKDEITGNISDMEGVTVVNNNLKIREEQSKEESESDTTEN